MRLIDGDALMKDICDSLDQMTNIGIVVDGDWLWAKLNDAIDNAPTIEERKKGTWIIEPYDAQNDIFIHRCGTCMRVAMLGGHTTKYKYCPICGSAMEWEQP